MLGMGNPANRQTLGYFGIVGLLGASATVLIGVLGIAADITGYKRAEQEREELITQLQEAVGNAKTLSGLLPICSHCKKIRNDEGYWHQIESFIHRHSGTQFSHGVCPECLEKHYSKFLGDKLDKYLEKKND
jgi:hypothetical protein